MWGGARVDWGGDGVEALFFFALIPDRPASMLHLEGRAARRDGSVEEVDMRRGGARVDWGGDGVEARFFFLFV
jgi:hypothetical protein